MSKTSFETELKVRGLQLSENEVKKLMKMAFDDYKENTVKEFALKKGKELHNIVFTIAIVDALNTMLHNIIGMAVKRGEIVREFKRDYNALMKATDNYRDTFIKMFKDMDGFEDALLSYSDDFFILFNNHLKSINYEEVNN